MWKAAFLSGCWLGQVTELTGALQALMPTAQDSSFRLCDSSLRKHPLSAFTRGERHL